MVLVLSIVGALAFGLVVGWITYRTLRRAQSGNGLSDIATVIGAVGGAAVTALFPQESGAFGAYCIGLGIGFFGYYLDARRRGLTDLLGPEHRGRDSDAAGAPRGERSSRLGSGELEPIAREDDTGVARE